MGGWAGKVPVGQAGGAMRCRERVKYRLYTGLCTENGDKRAFGARWRFRQGQIRCGRVLKVSFFAVFSVVLA